MLLRLLKFPYANTKARALIAGYLGREDFDTLGQAPSRQSAVTMLRERRRLPVEDQIREAEIQLRSDLFALGGRVARTLAGRERRLLETYLRRVDVENVKTVCRGVLTERGPERFQPLLVPAPSVAAVPVDRLAEASSFDDLLDILARHPLRAVLGGITQISPERRLHLLEVRLDLFFWAEVRERLLELAPFDRRAALEILGLRADVDRWQVVQRGWAAGLEAEEILAALPPLGSSLDSSAVEKALLAEQPGERLREVFPVKGIADPFGPAGETVLFRRLYWQLRRTLVAPPFDIAIPLSAVLLKELEVRDLQVILSGLRLGREPENIAPFLVSTEG